MKDPQGRYALATFACGSNLGPYEAARHIPGITAHEISLVKNRHATIAKLNKALAEVVNAFAARCRQGMGGRVGRGHRRHPGRHLHPQPAGRDQH